MQVTSVAPLRDLSPDDVARMRGALRGWSDRCSSILEDVETHMAEVQAAAAARATAEREAAAKLNKAMAEVRESDKTSGGGREQQARRGMNKRSMLEAAAKASAVDEVMDLDGPFSGDDTKKRASKRKM